MNCVAMQKLQLMYIFIIMNQNNILMFSFKGKILNPSMPLNFYGLNNNSIISVEEMKAQKTVQWKNPNELTWTLRFEIRTYENFSIDVQIDPDLSVKEVILFFQIHYLILPILLMNINIFLIIKHCP